jgi:Protein of unknown function (DUF1592)/Protein of unknown function (DUF1588)/Protein of unknown function (DUF1595)/Protein of unknown function (DUF1585)
MKMLFVSSIIVSLATLMGVGCRSDAPDAAASGGRSAGSGGGTGPGNGTGGGVVASGAGVPGTAGATAGQGAMPAMAMAGTTGAAGAAGTTGAAGTLGAAGTTGAADAAASSPLSPLPPASNATATPESAGTFALQHLTVAELKNTLADLLGAAPAVVADAVDNAGLPPLDDAGDASNTGYIVPGAFEAAQTQGLWSVAEQLVTAVPTGALPASCVAPASGAETTACATLFVETFGRRAFRRPVTPAETAALVALFDTAMGLGFDVQGSLIQVVRGMLQSPGFLYHWEVGDDPANRSGGLIALTPYQIASRLSYTLWQTMPDETLLAAADSDQLSTPDQILAQANRLLADGRSTAGLANFHRQWLGVTAPESLSKDPTLFPDFVGEGTWVGEELDTFVSTVVSTALPPAGDGTLQTLLTAPYTYQDATFLQRIYGAAEATPPDPLTLDPAERAGILTQIAFLATNASATSPDPIERGVVVWQRLLCAPFDSHPPGLLPPPSGQLDPAATLRQVYTQQDSNTTCVSCHASFDPLGFAFGNYDAVGAYQTLDNGQVIDASGETVTPGGAKLTFRNAVELVTTLAGSDEVKWCVTRQWFRFVLGRMESGSDQGSVERAFRAGAAVPGFSIRQMLTSLVQTQTFRFRVPSPGEM